MGGRARSRGRPFHSARHASVRPGWSSHQGRVAWLLRVNRLYGPTERWTRTAAFAEAFQGGLWRERTSVCRISRWETAAVRAPYLGIRRYEELLELPRDLLVAIVDSIYRYTASAVDSAPMLDRGVKAASGPSSRLEQLLEAARSDVLMSGSDWDELTAFLAVTPHQLITPRSAWAEIAERLLAETIVADGVAWMQRYEALSRLLAHPGGEQAAVAACASLGSDRNNQVFVETVSALDASSHPDASRQVLRQLMHPTNERAQYGALLACVRKLRYRHFTQPQLRQLAPVLHGLILDPAWHADARPLAAELLRTLPPDCGAGVAQLRAALAGNRRLPEVVRTGRLADAEVGELLVARVVDNTVTAMAREVPSFDDRMLPVLVDELLHSPVFDERLYAALTIYGTPYRAPLATALALELAGSAVHRPEAATALLEGLRILGGAEHRPIIERLVTAAGVPSPVTVAAAAAIGHVGGRSDDRFWLQAIGRHAHLWTRTGDHTHAAALNGLIYGLGIARNTAVLRLVRDGPQVPGRLRAAASWWLNQPHVVYESARR